MFNFLGWFVHKPGSSATRRNTYNLVEEHAGALSHVYDGSHWRLTGVRNLGPFFRALLPLVPNGSMLCLAGGAWSDKTQDVLNTISWDMDPTESVNLGLDFVEAYYISITEKNMAKLAELAEHSAEPEIAIHLAVLFEDERLLEWFDLPDDPIYISETIRGESVSRFADSLGRKYWKIIFCDNRTLFDV